MKCSIVVRIWTWNIRRYNETLTTHARDSTDGHLEGNLLRLTILGALYQFWNMFSYLDTFILPSNIRNIYIFSFCIDDTLIYINNIINILFVHYLYDVYLWNTSGDAYLKYLFRILKYNIQWRLMYRMRQVRVEHRVDEI